MIANITDHFKFIRANVEHLRKNVTDCPELLKIGQDVANLSDLRKRLGASKSSITATSKEITRLQVVLDGFKNDSRFHPVDLIENNVPELNSTKRNVQILFGSAVLFGCVWWLYKYL